MKTLPTDATLRNAISQQYSPTSTQDIDLKEKGLNTYFIDAPKEIPNNISQTDFRPDHFLGGNPDTFFIWEVLLGWRLKVSVKLF